jgi:hypothetical protein
MPLLSKIRASYSLIRIRRLLDLHSLLVSPSLIRRPSTTATDADEPEECSRAGEEDCYPGSPEHGQSEATFDAVGFEDVVECRRESSEKDGGYE